MPIAARGEGVGTTQSATVEAQLQELSIEEVRSLSREQAQELFSSLGGQLSQLSGELSVLVPKLPLYELNRYQKMLDSFDVQIETLRKGIVSTRKFSFGSWTVEAILEETCCKDSLVTLNSAPESIPQSSQGCEQESFERFGSFVVILRFS